MKAFTLIEVLISLIIISFLIGAIYTVLNYGSAAYDNDLGRLDLRQQVRQAMDGMIRELRQTNELAAEGNLSIPSVSVINFSFPPETDTYSAAWIGPISYYLDTVQHRIIREYPAGTTKIIASDITDLGFSLSGDILNITITSAKTVRQRNVSLTLKGRVRLRNE